MVRVLRSAEPAASGDRAQAGPADPDVLAVHGGIPLGPGPVRISGFKHSLVTAVAAAVAGSAPLTLAECPDIVETRVLAELVRGLGGQVEHAAGTLRLDCARLDCADLPPEAIGRIHGSVYLLPALLARFGRVHMPATGGCRIGAGEHRARPVAQYVSVLERFGASVREHPDGALEVSATRLTGCTIDLLDYAADRQLRSGPLYSGATKTALLTAAVADGVSVLRNIYPKPDVTDAVSILRAMGADLDHGPDGTLTIRGRGPQALCRPAAHTLIPDLIEVVTWICAGATASADGLQLTAPGLDRALTALAPELEVLDLMGVRLETGEDRLTVSPGELKPAHALVASHGVYSDSQPFLALLAAHARGSSSITETVWSNRFSYAEGLAELGVDARLRGSTLHIEGPCPPARPGRTLIAADLRAAAVLLLAALSVPGLTVLHGARHLARGYPDLPASLRALGAAVTAPANERS